MSIMIDILNKVCEKKQVFPAQIMSHCREAQYSNARTLMWVAMRMCGISSTKIGKFSHRDHTTIITMTRLHEKKMSREAAEILKDLGLIAYKMSVKPQEMKKLDKVKEKVDLPPPEEEEILIERKVPNYKTGEIETVWMKQAWEKSSLAKLILKDGALCVSTDWSKGLR